jgi:hypothetical protein
MPREMNKTRACIECNALVGRGVKRCPPCAASFLKRRPTYQRTPEHRQRMTEATKGKPKQVPPPSLQPEVALRIREWWTPERREAARQRGLLSASDPAWRLKIAHAVAGPNNPRWEDGRAALPYTPGFSGTTRKLVKDRDDHACQSCGSLKNLCVHHKDFAKENHELENLVLLCRKCHTREHRQHQKNTRRQD